jgi:hypothetical protein
MERVGGSVALSYSRKALLLAAGGVATVLAASPASAQYFERDRNQSVRERPHPDYDPIGVPLGGFRGYLTVPVGVAHDDNIYALPNGEDDTIFTLRPRAEVRSQWSQHYLEGTAEVDQETYQDHDSENRTDATLTGAGRIDIQRGFSANVNASAAWLEEPRTEASAPVNTLEPVSYDVYQLGAGLQREFVRLRVSGRADAATFDFDNARLNDPARTPVLQDDRDFEALTFTGRADYALTPATAVFGTVTVSQRDYELQPGDHPDVLFSRDSKGQTIALGANFDITNLIRGEVALGYLQEDFIDPNFTDIDSLSASASVEWFPSELATVELSAERVVTPTGVVGQVGALSTTLAARVDYEMRRNVILTGQLSHRNDDYKGVAGREDDGLAAAVDVLYLLNQHVGASVSYERTQRDSSGAAPGVEFDKNRFGLNLVLRY